MLAPINVLGYSERGIINALFDDIARTNDPAGVLNSLLTLAVFPFTPRRPTCSQATILVEQSFSRFGASDAVAFIGARNGTTCSVFCEAKVKTFCVPQWTIQEEFRAFRVGLDKTVSSSNLFAQLLYKVCLVEGLRRGGVALLKEGLRFPSWSTRRKRSIGHNNVVLDAVKLLSDHLETVFYLAIVPDSTARVAEFFRELQSFAEPRLDGMWDVSTYGYLTWAQVHMFCEAEGLTRALAVFEHNTGQIY